MQLLPTLMKEVATYLKNLKGRTLLLTHHNADLDAVTSVIVLKEGLAQTVESFRESAGIA